MKENEEQIKLKKAKEVFNKANKKFKAGDYKGAKGLYTEAIELDHEYAEAYRNRGVTNFNLKAHDEELADYEKAISINSKFAEAYYNRNKLFEQSNNK